MENCREMILSDFKKLDNCRWDFLFFKAVFDVDVNLEEEFKFEYRRRYDES